MTDGKSFDVFLSHNSKDKPWVIRLKNALEDNGIKVWLDKDQIRPGDLFAYALERGISESKAVAIVITPEAMESDWVKAEYYRAFSLATTQGVQLIPVLLQMTEIPGFLKDRSWIDFQDDTAFEENIKRLIWGITGNKKTEVSRQFDDNKKVKKVPNDIYVRIRNAFLLCDEFDSDNKITSLFIQPKLEPWRYSLPQAQNISSRVDLIIAFLSNKRRNDTNENGLIILLQILSARYDLTDDRSQILKKLSTELENLLNV